MHIAVYYLDNNVVFIAVRSMLLNVYNCRKSVSNKSLCVCPATCSWFIY